MQDELIGKRLREYAILQCVGQGGMARVYKARHVLLDELRAIKLLNPEGPDSMKEFKARFQREAQILVRLKHAHVVTVHEFGVLGREILFMVMEYLEGVSLRSRLRQKGWLPEAQCIEIAKQTALGLAAVHQQGIVHRDVSPDNIVLVPEDDSENVKIIDFGIAKNVIAVEATKLTDTLKFVGKAEYCSPEQIQGPLSGDIDGRSDIYSLGITLYEMLTGSRPFRAKTPQGYIAKHLKSAPIPFEEVNPEARISSPLADLVMRMLEKKRAERPASMMELFQELSAIAHQHPVPTPVW
ncbi:MAG: serine/threonine protein kinase [Vicinamibacteria bacterium]